MPLKFNKISYVRSEQELPGFVSVYFKRPETYSFIAGQYAIIMLGENLSDKELTHTMSIASAPEDIEICFTMKTDSKSLFKQKIQALQAGDEIEISDARGLFVLPKDSSKICWIAGGIGITPYRSMWRSTGFQVRSTQLIHVSHEGYVFQDEYKQVGFEYHSIDFAELEKIMNETEKDYYFIAGSPSFVNAVKELCYKKGIYDEQIVLDIFAGYE
jgi:ferredoxin-NADP reductase